MKDSFKVDFHCSDSFTIFFITDNIFETEEEYKILFKFINDTLYKKYSYSLHGFYDVVIYFYKGIYVLDFELIDDYGRKDFDVTLFINSNMLYEFNDMNLIDKEKIYYQDKFYTEIDNIIDDIRLYEYGRIVYGKDVDEILKNGILLT